MIDWEVTSTTIYCGDVNGDVTLLLAKDMSVKCTGQEQYEKNKNYRAGVLFRRKSKKLKEWKCRGVNCSQLSAYRDKIFSEEANLRVKI